MITTLAVKDRGNARARSLQIDARSAPDVIAISHRPVGRPPCMKEPEFRRILRPVGQLFLVSAAKQRPRARRLLRCARNDIEARRSTRTYHAPIFSETG